MSKPHKLFINIIGTGFLVGLFCGLFLLDYWEWGMIAGPTLVRLAWITLVDCFIIILLATWILVEIKKTPKGTDKQG